MNVEMETIFSVNLLKIHGSGRLIYQCCMLDISHNVVVGEDLDFHET